MADGEVLSEESVNSSNHVTIVKPAIDDRIRERDLEFRKRETVALLAWSNNFLRQRQFEAASLTKDFADGVLLINLIELTFGVSLGKYRVNPRQPFHKLENVSQAFAYMEKILGIILLGIDTNDIVQRQEKQTINVLWNLMRAHVLRGIGVTSGDSSTSTIRSHLLQWATNILGSGFDIKDFWDSFKNGVAFCGIVNNLVPGSIDVSKLNPDEAEKNLSLAFSVAEQNLGIPALLSASDFASGRKPDEQAVINYLCMLVSAAQGKSKTAAEMEKLRVEKEQEKLSKEQELQKMKDLLRIKEEEEQRKRDEHLKQMESMQSAMQQIKHQQALQAEQEKEKFLSELGSAQTEVSALKSLREKEQQQFQKAFEDLQALVKQQQATLIASFDQERRGLEEEIRKLQAEVASLKDQLAQLQNLRRQEAFDAQGRINELTAQLYAAHREYEDVVENFRASMRKEAINKRVVLDAEEQQDSFTRILQASINQEKSLKDFLFSLPDKTGWLLKKRPDNKVMHTGDRKRFFMLKGDMVYSNKDPSKGNKEQSYFSLEGYQLIDRTGLKGGNIDPSLAAALGSPKSEEDKALAAAATASNHRATSSIGRRLSAIAQPDKDKRRRSSLVTTNAKGAQVIRLVPKDPKNKVLDLSPVTEEKDIKVEDLWEWVDNINTRISLINYLNGIGGLNRASLARGGREILAFICDPTMTELKLENKVADIHLALTHFKDILSHRRNFNISFVNIALSDADCEVLAEILAVNEYIETVELVQNLITPKGAAHLAKALRRNSSIKVLRLDFNAIKDQGLIALAEAVFYHRQLNTLSFSGNNIGDSGAVAVVQALIESQQKFGTPHVFPHLDLSHNLIGDATMKAVAELLQMNDTIRIVTVDTNVVTDEGIGYVADAIATKKTGVVELHARDNQLTSKGLLKLANVLKNTTGPFTIDVSNNKLISRKGINALLTEASESSLEFVQFHIVRRGGDKEKEEKGKEKEKENKEKETDKEKPKQLSNQPPDDGEDF